MHLYLFFFNDTATTEIYTLSLHDALPISGGRFVAFVSFATNLAAGDSDSSFISGVFVHDRHTGTTERSEEHTSEPQSQSNLVCRLLLEKKNRSATSSRFPGIY